MQVTLTSSLLSAACLLAVTPAQAQTAPNPPAPPPATVAAAAPDAPEPPRLHSLQVQGDNPLSADETSQVLSPFLRQPASLDTVAAAAAALEAALQAHGYSLYKVGLPPQTLDGALRLEVLRFNLAQVNVRGNQYSDRDNLLASLPELVPGQSPNLLRLGLQTRLANTSPYKQLRVGLRESATPDSVDASIEVQDHSPWLFGADLTNTGSAATGQDRITFLASHSNLFNRDHGLSAAWTTSAQARSDVRQWGLSYRVPLYALSGALSASVSRSNVVGRFGAFSSTGAGNTTQFGYTQLLPTAGDWSGEWSLNLNDRLFNGAQLQDASGNPIAGTTTPDTRSRSLTLGHAATLEGNGATLAYNLNWSRALNGGSGNTLAAYTNGGTNPAITTLHWQALRGGATLQLPLPGQWLLTLRGDGQASPDALIAGEQFGLGGATSVRGVPERILQGDSGLQTTVELRGPELRPGLNLLGFIDTGWLSNHHPNATTRLGSDHLISAGLGLRWVTADGVSLSLDYGRVLVGSLLPAASAPTAPHPGDQRLHLNVSLRF